MLLMSEVPPYYWTTTFSFLGSSGRLFEAESGSFLQIESEAHQQGLWIIHMRVVIGALDYPHPGYSDAPSRQTTVARGPSSKQTRMKRHTMPMAPMSSQWLQRVPSPQNQVASRLLHGAPGTDAISKRSEHAYTAT